MSCVLFCPSIGNRAFLRPACASSRRAHRHLLLRKVQAAPVGVEACQRMPANVSQHKAIASSQLYAWEGPRHWKVIVFPWPLRPSVSDRRGHVARFLCTVGFSQSCPVARVTAKIFAP